MGRSDEIEQFAAHLRMLKDRTGRSFDALGKRAGVSGSSLHRYCAGTSVPPDYGVIQAFAKVCGATRQELRELHRLWALADASREALPPNGLDDAAGAPTETVAGAPTETEASTAAMALTSPAAPTPGADVDGDRTTTPTGAGPAGTGPAQPAAPAGTAPAGTAPAGTDPAGTDPAGTGRRRQRRALVLAAVLGVVAVLGATAWMTSPIGNATVTRDNRLLFSPACKAEIGMGRHDECVREVQNLLKKAGTKVGVDGEFGPETLKRVTAFQVLAGLTVNGVVDDPTKRALYEQKVSMATWPKEKVAQRIREVFVEDPEKAVRIADCASYLDPLWVLPNVNLSRNWGVFQLSDAVLRKYNGTPLQAYDPEWNIQNAHREWAVERDFRAWPACDRASGNPASAEPTEPAPDDSAAPSGEPAPRSS
ncbi:MAG TPA: helix-turn-helix domain-containing protein [Catenuloplanes sp.]